MARVEELRELLRSEYSIKTEKDLEAAIRKSEKLDISIFVLPIQGKEMALEPERKCV